MITDYSARKKEVLDSFEIIEKLVRKIRENAEKTGISDPFMRFDSLLTDIRHKAENVKADRFRLMIAGEAKSGKSTFINAYLGVELLPMDVKQCTSSIVEIKYGQEFFVRATYANGKQKEIKGDVEAKKFLKENAALDDRYRDIPVPTINQEILVKSGLRSQEKSSSIHIKPQEIEELVNADEIQTANIHNLPTDEYKKKIREYIEYKKNDWKNIVTKIEVLFPFKDESIRGIEIIDSPGVCARGGVAEVTSKYIESADAVIFLKPASGQALESTQFNEFMSNASVQRNQNALFLVLTRITNVTALDLRRLQDETNKQFCQLNKENILFVDSKAELYVKQLQTINPDKIQEKLLELNDSGSLDDFVKACFFDSGNIIEKLQEKSQFNQVYQSLEIFGRKAHYILLASLLESINQLYSKLWNDLKFQRALLHQKAEDPKELAQKIININKELEGLEERMSVGIDELHNKFSGDEGVIKIAVKKSQDEYEKILPSVTTFDQLKACSFDKIEEFKKLTTKLQMNYVEECDHLLIKINDRNAIPYESLQPYFTEEMFQKIFEREAQNSMEDATEGITFKKTNFASVYSQNKHLNNVKNSIEIRIKQISDDAIQHLNKFVKNCGEGYKDILINNANNKKEELSKIEKAKITAEEIQVIIGELDHLLCTIKDEQFVVSKKQKGIANHVQ